MLVTHKLNEIMEIADRVTVMRDGQVVATRAIGETSGEELTRLMVGRDVNLRADKAARAAGKPVLQIADLRVCDETGHEKVCGVSLDVHARRNPRHRGRRSATGSRSSPKRSCICVK